MKVLVADDSLIYRKMIAQLLESWGCQVVFAKDGDEALAVLNGGDAPRIAILDGMMPGLNGTEVCSALRRGSSPYVYIILLTAGGEADAKQAFEAGADDYLRKPPKDFELRSCLLAGARLVANSDLSRGPMPPAEKTASHSNY